MDERYSGERKSNRQRQYWIKIPPGVIGIGKNQWRKSEALKETDYLVLTTVNEKRNKSAVFYTAALELRFRFHMTAC